MEYLYLLAGLVLILAGANYLTDGSVALAERFRVPGFLIGLTIVAVGTSTPELVVSFLSALEGEGDMAVGNVVGSNIANILLILGLCSTVVPLTPGGTDAVTLGAVVLSSLLLFAAAFTFRRRALDRWEGVLFLAIYSAYLWWLLAK